MSDHMTVKEGLQILGIDPPKIRRGMSQADVNKLVAEWRDGELKKRYRKLLIEAHPDRHEDSEESNRETRRLRTAYEAARKLRLRKPRESQDPKPPPRPPPGPPPKNNGAYCMWCGAKRTPDQALHCHECGSPFANVPEAVECPACGRKRMPPQAKHCYHCGFAYQRSGDLRQILLERGLSPMKIKVMETHGLLRKLEGIDPNDAKFDMMVRAMGLV